VGSLEVSLVDLVHGGKIVNVAQKHTAFYCLIERGTGGFQDGFDVIEHEPCLASNIPENKLARLWVDGTLTRNEDKTVGNDGLRIWCLRSRALGGFHDFLHGQSLLSKITKIGKLPFVTAESNVWRLSFACKDAQQESKKRRSTHMSRKSLPGFRQAGLRVVSDNRLFLFCFLRGFAFPLADSGGFLASGLLSLFLL
jgi:hypothetical protein